MTDVLPDPDLVEVDEEPEPSRRDGLFVVSVAVALLAVLVAVVGVAFAMRALDESEEAGSGGSTQAETIPVSLSEFAISPATVATGGSLHVTNDGSIAHNLAVEGADVKSKDLGATESEHLSLGGLAPGSYTMYCTIPGHRESGMEAALTVTAGPSGASSGDSAAGDHSAHGDMDYAAMTEAMTASMTAFPAETEGVGNAVLEPTEVLADGTKVFDLVAAITKWEKAPGEVVDAWTYNGIVPAPSIHLEVGDKAHFRLRNDLPIGTDLHLHGLNMENRFDGVAPLTQPVIEPGETFTYEYVADRVSVAMYHPHFHSQIGLPNGMFGTVFVGQVPIPRGGQVGAKAIPADVTISQEFPMVVNDAGVIGYSLNGKSFPATAPIVAQNGEWVLFHYFNEGTQIHPMHLHRFDQIVVAKDGYPLDSPYTADVVNVAPGERYSVLVHLDKPGTWVWHCHILPHVENEEGMFGMVTAVVVQ
ncbi:MAG: multicopper oxidase domain-containing protein [Acidimicrobiia bacterium]